MNSDKFSVEEYKKNIELMKNRGFRFHLTSNFEEKSMLMRHDIDLNLEISVQMSEIEKNMGVRSIYCIMVKNPLYSIDTVKALSHLHKIMAGGHEIGLHYDPAIESAMPFEKQLAFLEMKIGRSIRFFSQHQPIKHRLQKNIFMEKYVDLYGKMYTNEYKYISDSCMKPREDIRDAVKSYDRVQYLTHPEFWIIGGKSLDEFKSKMEKKIEANKIPVLASLVEEMKESINERGLIDSEILGN